MHNATATKGFLYVSLVALMSLLLSACVPITPVPGTPAPEQEEPAAATPAPESEGEMLTLEGVTWQLAQYTDANGVMTVPGAEATISFQDGQVSGSTGCNRFFAGYTVEGNQLTVEQAGSTMMACPEPAMTQERDFLNNIVLAASYEIVENQLQISDAAGTIILTFDLQAAASLTGVLWRATNYNNGQQAVVGLLDGSEILAVFGEDGNLSGSAGCNNYFAAYTTDGNQISIGPAGSTQMMCDQPAGVMEQESAYLLALETAATYSIQGDTLEMRTAEDAMVALYQNAGPALTDPGAVEEGAATPVITDITWQWVETAYGDDTTLTIDDPSKYTLTLASDGTVALQVDCNTGGGSHTLGDSVITLDVAVMTRMACPEGTLSDVFIRELSAAATFVMDGEDLVLNLFADSGNMRFSPAQ